MDKARGAALPRGLSEAEAERSRREHGENVLPRRRRRSFLAKFISNLKDPVIKILLFALGVNVLFLFHGGDVAETVGIALSVLIATLISTLSEHGSEAAFLALGKSNGGDICRAVRGGAVRAIPADEVVVGDVLLLSAGEAVMADGLLLSGELMLDMSAMTGESREVEKRPSRDGAMLPDSPSSVLRGCYVTSGEGVMRVCAVGARTYLGGICHEVQGEVRDSPLRMRLATLARQISRLGYVAAILVAAAFLFNVFIIDSGFRSEVIFFKLSSPVFLFSKLLDAFTLALTVIVVAVPEGLPMMIAVVLSRNVRRMARAGVLVKKPAGIEAAGCMNVLFTDKTGTLTEGRMRVSGVLSGDGEYFSSAERYFSRHGDALYLLNAYFNTSASAGRDADGRAAAVGGNTTDRAILSSVLERLPPAASVRGRVPFDSARKFCAVSLDTDGRRVCIYKGAPDLLLSRVKRRFDADGRQMPLDKYRISSILTERCSRGERAVAVAVGDETLGPLPDELTLVCVIFLSDGVRRGAAAAIGRLCGAGVHTVMVTGDGIETASAVARECGILGGGVDIALTSAQLGKMSDDELSEKLHRIGVVARALPSDKSRLVRVAQNAGLVVGMTGDGINDAPALRAADVGFAMGSGSSVAKEAADVVILRDDADSIANAALYGRTVFKSIRKFITLQLMMNFCAVGVSMIAPFIGIDEPVTVVQMLWINIIMDTLGGLAFAGEPALDSYMREKPKGMNEPILNRYMVEQIVMLGLFTVGISIAFLKGGACVSRFRPECAGIYHLTGFFVFFIFASVYNCFNARTDRLRLFSGILRNFAFVCVMLTVAAVQIAFVYLGGAILRTAPLTAAELAFSMVLPLFVFPFEFLRKILWRLRGKKGGY